MELGWSALALLCLAGLIAWFWQDSLAARESANAAAMDACQRLGLQFLDGTAAFVRLSPARESGRLKLRRTYVFDYTANSIERRQGFVVLIGSRVESVGYAPDEISPGNAQRPQGSAHRPQDRDHTGAERRFLHGTNAASAPDAPLAHPARPPAIEFQAQFKGPVFKPGGVTAFGAPADPPSGASPSASSGPFSGASSAASAGAPEPGKNDPPQGHAATDGASNILDLAQWRARNRPTPPAGPLNREDRRH
jgi:hypothetical protein